MIGCDCARSELRVPTKHPAARACSAICSLPQVREARGEDAWSGNDPAGKRFGGRDPLDLEYRGGGEASHPTQGSSSWASGRNSSSIVSS